MARGNGIITNKCWVSDKCWIFCRSIYLRGTSKPFPFLLLCLNKMTDDRALRVIKHHMICEWFLQQNAAHYLRILYYYHWKFMMWIYRLAPSQDELFSHYWWPYRFITWWLWTTLSILWWTVSSGSATWASPATIRIHLPKNFDSEFQIINASLI